MHCTLHTMAGNLPSNFPAVCEATTQRPQATAGLVHCSGLFAVRMTHRAVHAVAGSASIASQHRPAAVASRACVWHNKRQSMASSLAHLHSLHKNT